MNINFKVRTVDGGISPLMTIHESTHINYDIALCGFILDVWNKLVTNKQQGVGVGIIYIEGEEREVERWELSPSGWKMA